MKNIIFKGFLAILFLCFITTSVHAYSVNEWASMEWENYPVSTVDWEVLVKNGDGSNWNVGIYQPGGSSVPVAQNNPGEIDWVSNPFENPFTLTYSASSGIVSMIVNEATGTGSSDVVWDTGAAFSYKDLYIVAKHTETGQNTLIESVQLNGDDIGDITTGQVGGGANYTKAGWHIEADPGEVFTDIVITGFISFDQAEAGIGDSEFNAIFGAANPVPVPGAVWLLGSGILGIASLRRKKLS